VHQVANRYRETALLFGALSHPARLRILDELRRGTACVCHLQNALHRPQPYVSQQLRLLRDAGFTDTRRDGLFVYYYLADPRVERLLDIFLGPRTRADQLSACECPACQETRLASR
jgi:ArsR family transcriptional regulator